MNVLKKPSSITLYTKASCPWCIEAKDWLHKMGWEYQNRDVNLDRSARDEAIKLSGQSKVPVIAFDGLVLGDYDTDQLESFLKKHAYLS